MKSLKSVNLFLRMVTPVIVLDAALLIGSEAKGSILTFDLKGTAGVPLPPAYGDRIDATAVSSGDAVADSYGLGNGTTPNILMDYSPLGTPIANSSILYYNDATWVEKAELFSAATNDGTVFRFTFTPDAGFAIRINSFDLFDYPGWQTGTGDHTLDWQVLDGVNQLASGSKTVAQSVSLTTESVNPIMTSFFTGPVVLELIHTGRLDDLALDNLNFDQIAVPEPSSLCLVAMPAILLLLRWRNCKNTH